MTRKGVTLIEIMIVVATIALVAVIVVPNLARAKYFAECMEKHNDKEYCSEIDGTNKPKESMTWASEKAMEIILDGRKYQCTLEE